jgi:hypothetical protein
VALGHIHVFSPQGRVGTAHHLAVGGSPWEDDVVRAFGLEGRTGGLTVGGSGAGFRQADAQTLCFLKASACQLPLLVPSAPTLPGLSLGWKTPPLETEDWSGAPTSPCMWTWEQGPWPPWCFPEEDPFFLQAPSCFQFHRWG